MIFARNVRHLREALGWSQAELGRHVGLGQSRTAAIEATGSVTIDQADAFAVAFAVPVEVLLYDQPAVAKKIPVRRLMKIAAAFDLLHEEIKRLIDSQTAD